MKTSFFKIGSDHLVCKFTMCNIKIYPHTIISTLQRNLFDCPYFWQFFPTPPFPDLNLCCKKSNSDSCWSWLLENMSRPVVFGRSVTVHRHRQCHGPSDQLTVVSARDAFASNKLAKLGDAIAISKSETMNHSLTH